MAIGTGALGQYAIGQSQAQALAISPSLLTNTNVFYGFNLGLQAIVASLLLNTSVFFSRISIWSVRRKDAETWTERNQQSETWTRR